MSFLDEGLAFSFPHIRRLQELGIRAMEVAQETARQEEDCMKELRECIAMLPPEVDTRSMKATLDKYQGTMELPNIPLNVYEGDFPYSMRKPSSF